MSSAIDILRGCGRARAILLAAVGAALVAMAACGGGDDRVSTFRPQRMVVLGDESSVILEAGSTDVQGNPISAPVGSKYTVNALASGSTTAVDCVANPLWVQVLGSRFGFTFAECNPGSVATQARIYARVGARVADLPAQVAAVQAANGAFVPTDLVTVMVGQADILAAYQAYAASPGAGTAAALAAVEAAGRSLAAQVNGIATANGRVIVATVPNQGSTPYAAAQEAGAAGRAALLTQLTQEFNGRMRGALINDGRLIGLVQADEQVQLIVNNRTAFGYANVTAAACTTPSAVNCTTSTLVSGATAGNFVWADDRHIAVDAQIRVGNLAVVRATNNPF